MSTTRPVIENETYQHGATRLSYNMAIYTEVPIWKQTSCLISHCIGCWTLHRKWSKMQSTTSIATRGFRYIGFNYHVDKRGYWFPWLILPSCELTTNAMQHSSTQKVGWKRQKMTPIRQGWLCRKEGEWKEGKGWVSQPPRTRCC